METINKIKKELPGYRFVPIKKLTSHSYRATSNLCVANHSIIAYVVIDKKFEKKNPFHRQLIQMGLLREGSNILMFHKDNFVEFLDSTYDDLIDIKWILSNLNKGDLECLICYEKLIRPANTCVKCQSTVCYNCYLKIIEEMNEWKYKCPICQIIYIPPDNINVPPGTEHTFIPKKGSIMERYFTSIMANST